MKDLSKRRGKISTHVQFFIYIDRKIYKFLQRDFIYYYEYKNNRFLFSVIINIIV